MTVLAPEDTYALFASTAQSFTRPPDPARIPTDFDLAVCQLPGEIIDRLAEGADSARRILEPLVKATEAGRLPREAGLLEIGCILAPREPCERIARTYAPARREDAIRRVVSDSRALRSRWGHRWTAYIALKNDAVPRPWRIIAGYEGPFEVTRQIEADLLAEAEERMHSIHHALHSPNQLAQLEDRSGLYEQVHRARLAQWLLGWIGDRAP